MEKSDILFRLVYYALIEIREQGVDTKNDLVYKLSDLFHNVVLAMGKAAKGDRDYDEVMAVLEEKAKSTGCEAWLRTRCEHIQKLSQGE